MNSSSAPDLQHQLLVWFAQNSRDLPWRRTYHPYHVWISEIMLQQTQMERVVQYFSRWLERFPDVPALADADEHEVLRLWEGLGYYSRAANLLKSARLIRDRHAGRIPEDYNALLALPGIGRYTAGAIMSIAFNHDQPLVDANVERVFARIFDLSLPVKDKECRRLIWQKAAELLPPGKARFFNQALMEHGALVCLPQNPRCDRCPCRNQCQSHALGIVGQRPVPGKVRETIFIEMATGVLVDKGKIFIQQRRQDDIWPSLWEFPGGGLQDGETPEEALTREYLEETELRIRVQKKIAVIKHSYTRYRVTLHCYFCELAARKKKPKLHAAQDYRWVAPQDLKQYAFPAPHRRLIGKITAIGG